MRKRPSRPDLLATYGLLALYVATYSGRMYSFDGFLVYRQAQAIAFEHTVHFPPFVFAEQQFSVSFYGLGASLIQVPTLLTLRSLRSATAVVPDFYSQPLFSLAVAPLFLLITATAALLVYHVIVALGGTQRAGLWGMLFYGVGSPAIVYARGDFAQPLEGLCWIAALFGVIEFRRRASPLLAVLASVSVMYAGITRPAEGTLVALAVIGLSISYTWDKPRDHGTWYLMLLVSGAFLVAILLNLFWNAVRYGSPFETGVAIQWTTPLRTGLVGAVLSPGRGILLAFPAAILVPIGLHFLWSRRQQTVAVALGFLIFAQLLVTAKWFMWYGGVNWGLRIFYTALPVIGVAAGVAVDRRPSRRSVVCALLLAGGIIWAVPCIVTDLFTSGPAGGSEGSFWWSAYPPFGAWHGLKHLFATSFPDSNAVDIFWFRVARPTRFTSLLIAAGCVATGVCLLRKAFSELECCHSESACAVEPASARS